jgi:4-amino-4-deoxy-L-arabinose transferase-like glycosyltransferase
LIRQASGGYDSHKTRKGASEVGHQPQNRADRYAEAPGLKRTAVLLVVAALAALLIRAVVLAELWHELPFYHTTYKGFDQYTYNAWAREIAGGDWLSREKGVFFFTPLYPYALAIVYLVAGPGNVAAGVALNALFGVLAAVCAAGLARRLFGWWAGLAAGILMALNGSQIAWESQLLIDAMLTPICLGALWLVVELLARSREGRPARLAWWLAPGLLLGLASVGRGSNLLVTLVMAAAVAATLRARPRRRAAVAALLLVGAALPIGLCTLRHGLMYGRWTSSSHGGINLYLGNIPGASGTYAASADYETDGRDIRDDRYWREKLLSQLRAEPLSLVPTMARKTLLFFNAWDIADNANYHFFRRYVTSLKCLTVGPLALYVLGFLGVILTLPRWRQLVVVYSFAVSFAASIIVVLVAGRYKLPFLAVLAIFGGAGLAALANEVRRRHSARLAAAVAGTALLTVAFWPRPAPGSANRMCPLRPLEFDDNARILLKEGRRRQAAAMFEDGATLFPERTDLAGMCSWLYLDSGRPERALACVERVLARGFVSRDLMENRAIAYLKLDRHAEARSAAEQLLARYPGNEVGQAVMDRIRQSATSDGSEQGRREGDAGEH